MFFGGVIGMSFKTKLVILRTGGCGKNTIDNGFSTSCRLVILL